MIKYNATTDRIEYGSKSYKRSSETGFQLFNRWLRQQELGMLHSTKTGSVLVWNGQFFRYVNENGTYRTFTPLGRVGQFYLKKLKETMVLPVVMMFDETPA
jgi:hypothetical protein